MRSADLLRYGLWGAVAATAARNRQEYGVPTAWLTHLVGNTVTLLLPDAFGLLRRPLGDRLTHPLAQALLRTLDRHIRQDPKYAGYVAPLALGFIASHADFSIYHGRWAERTILGFGPDSIPHASAAYALARLASETVLTFAQEVPEDTALAQPITWAAEHVDALAVACVVLISITWEVSEYLAHIAEIRNTGRAPDEVNMQWSLPDAITDSFSNCAGLAAAILMRHAQANRVDPSHGQVATSAG